MTQNTYTRKTLRRAIGLKLRMPFFRKYAAGEGTIDSSSTASKIIDAMLTQVDNYWNGQWFYGLVAGDISLIRSFSAQSHSFQLETAMAATPTAGDKYEIFSGWSPSEIHDAINDAILYATRIFPQQVEDNSMVWCEDKMAYDLTSLSSKVFKVYKVWAERANSVIRGKAASGGATSLTISEAAGTISSVTSDYLISIYAGTGAGQIRNVSSVAGTQVNVSASWTTNPDGTSKYAIWNPNVQVYDWSPLDIFYVDTPEFPSTLRIRTRLQSYYGLRIKIQYQYLETGLTSDSSTTTIPQSFIVPYACSQLHGMRIASPKADRDLHFAEMQRFREIAAAYMTVNSPRKPQTTIPVSESGAYLDELNPMGWGE